jgi:hypothetical protein
MDDDISEQDDESDFSLESKKAKNTIKDEDFFNLHDEFNDS